MKIIGFAWRDDTIYRKVSNTQFETLLKHLNNENRKELDNFILNTLKPAHVSHESDATAVVWVNDPDIEWLKERWNAI